MSQPLMFLAMHSEDGYIFQLQCFLTIKLELEVEQNNVIKIITFGAFLSMLHHFLSQRPPFNLQD